MWRLTLSKGPVTLPSQSQRYRDEALFTPSCLQRQPRKRTPWRPFTLLLHRCDAFIFAIRHREIYFVRWSVLQCKPCESLVARIEASSHTFVLPVLKIWQPLAKCGHGCSGLTRRLLCAVYWVWAVISELLAQAVVHIARKEGHKSRDHIG